MRGASVHQCQERALGRAVGAVAGEAPALAAGDPGQRFAVGAEQLGIARANTADMVDQRLALALHAGEYHPPFVGQLLLGRIDDLHQAGARTQAAELAEALGELIDGTKPTEAGAGRARGSGGRGAAESRWSAAARRAPDQRLRCRSARSPAAHRRRGTPTLAPAHQEAGERQHQESCPLPLQRRLAPERKAMESDRDAP